jgi:ribosomal protein S18 acetylase RimI-like enzyme
MERIIARPFARADAAEMIGLMRELAVFEDYIDEFAVTEADLIENGLGASPRFGALVAYREGEEGLLGIAVHYVIPWTYDLKPTLVLKELYVAERARGLGVGRALMQSLCREAMSIGAPRIAWSVLPDNERAQRFYASLGGRKDAKFEPWTMDETAIQRLAG